MFYKIIWIILKIYFFIFYRFKTVGRENIPETGGLVFCSNHASMMDPLILAMTTKRRVYYVAKKELFAVKFISVVLKSLGAFPVDRQNTDMTAYKKSIDLLKDGRIIGVFAEGSRHKKLDAKNAKSGVALFALKSGAEVLPISISSSYKLFSTIRVNIGPAVDLNEYREKKIKTDMLNEITKKIMDEIGGLM